MGSCVSEKKHSTERQLRKDRLVLEDPSRDSSLLEDNPESPKKQANPSTVESEKTKTVLNLQDALQQSKIDSNENLDLEAWIESHNTTSSIIRLPKKRNSPNKGNLAADRCASVIEGFDHIESIDCELQTQQHMSKIVICSQELNIEFNLPQCRGGPLVVPYISYDKYSTQA